MTRTYRFKGLDWVLSQCHGAWFQIGHTIRGVRPLDTAQWGPFGLALFVRKPDGGLLIMDLRFPKWALIIRTEKEKRR